MFEKRLDVFGGDKTVEKIQAAFLQVTAKLGLDFPGEAGITFNPASAPALAQQKSGVVFKPVAHAELYKMAALDADAPENFVDDAIFAILGKNLALVVVQFFWVFIFCGGQFTLKKAVYVNHF